MLPLWIIAVAVAISTFVHVVSACITGALALRMRPALAGMVKRANESDDDDDGLPAFYREPADPPCADRNCPYCWPETKRADDRDPLTETGVRRVLDRAGVSSRFDVRSPPP